MNVQKRNDVSIYCLSSGPTLPEWLGERARRNLAKKDESIRRRIELLQDFQMPASSSRIVQSSDGRFIIAAGTYPPRIRCYDVHELGMKFERYVNATVIDIQMLGDDFGKFAILMDDRTIGFHAPYGAHESIRIPTFGRAMAYEPTSCELLLAAKGNQIYRFNLEEGRFGEPWSYETDASANCISINKAYPLAAVGCDDGTVRFWDNRSPDALLKPFIRLDIKSATKGYGFADEMIGISSHEITSVAQDPTGMYIAAGTAGGVVSLYDIRSSKPLHIKEHKHGLPVHTIKFHTGSGMILSSDEKLVKFWRYKASGDMTDELTNTEEHDTSIGAVKVNVESIGKISHFIMAGDESDPDGNKSGVLLCATDQPKMDSFFIPAIGLAPKWCSFLENITEELEERDLDRGGGADLVRDGQETVFENYKFVSKEDLEKLGISNLIGTPLLRGYMHGFFMDINLYNRVKAVANPFEYEQYQKKKLKERMEAKRGSRIAPRPSDTKTKTAVNPDLAERLETKARDSTKAGKLAEVVLRDERFGGLFTNPDFHIDEGDENFKLRNPSGIAAAKLKRNNLDSDDEDDSVPEEAGADQEIDDIDDHDHADEADGSSSEMDSDSDEDGFEGGKVRGEAYDDSKQLRKKSKAPVQKKNKLAVMDEMDGDDLDLGEDAMERARRRLEEMNMPLESRIIAEDKLDVRVKSGSKEATFVPRDAKRKTKGGDKNGGPVRGKRHRRGIKELGFKTPFKHIK